MQTSSKRLLLLFLLLIVITGSFLIVKYSIPHPLYPPLDQQRAALKNKAYVTPYRVLDSTQIADDLRFLSSDSCEGRRMGTKGHELAAERILLRMREAGVDSFNSLPQNFSGKNTFFYTEKGNFDYTRNGQNIIGWIKGTKYPEKYLVISAHYDHMGFSKDGQIYHGASDNASGTACLLAMAKYFKQHPQHYSLIFAAFDREESMMEGSGYFIETPPVDIHKIKFNLNIDMITRSDSNELFACGVYHYPSLKYIITKTQNKTNTKILMGHDKGIGYREDWTNLSDHYPFYLAHIPFLYFGTEDHPDLHRPTDTFEKTDLNNYIENCNLMVLVLSAFKSPS